MIRIIYSFLFLSFFFTISNAQVSEGPISFAPNRHISGYAKQLNDTLTLPFVDDFSSNTSGNPSSKRWMNGGGVFINNTFSNNPPTYNVASFDGLNATGESYIFGEDIPFSPNNGINDSLVSKAIDLSNFRDNDLNKVAISFYWQKGGISPFIAPELEEGDSLWLYFKDTSNSWIKAWPIDSTHLKPIINNTPGDTFEYVYLPIIDSAAFFHSSFQFKFEAYGRIDVLDDVWNIDYIYLDANRNNAPPNDFAFSHAPTSLLKDFQHLPFAHFINDPKSFLIDTVQATFSNLSNQTNLVEDSTVIVEENLLNNPALMLDMGTTDIDGVGIIPAESMVDILYIPDNDNISSTLEGMSYKEFDSINIRTKLSIETPIELIRDNNSVSFNTYIHDFYAYDDGSIEGIARNFAFGDIAIEFETPVSDSITAIDVYFPKFGEDQSGKNIVLKVWQSIGGVNSATEDREIARITTNLFHADSNETFYRYQLLKPVLVEAGKFYIGYLNPVSQEISIGLDKNNTSMDNVYQNDLPNQWSRGYKPIKVGSLMMRPVFEKEKPTVIGLEETSKSDLVANFYPNPTSEKITLYGDVRKAEIYDMIGNLTTETSFNSESLSKTIDVSFLNEGIYFLRLINGDKEITKKIVISK